MPILTEEVSLYPDTLLDSVTLESDGIGEADGAGGRILQRRWWVIYTKSRQEKALARNLLQREIPFYLPLVKRPALSRRRQVTVTTPLFSGYVFVWGTEEERVTALATNRVSRILTVDDSSQLERDLRQLCRLISAEVPLTVESRLVAGDNVRVRHGPLAGMEGTVLVRRGQTRLLVQIDFLQQGASVEIDDFFLEPIL